MAVQLDKSVVRFLFFVKVFVSSIKLFPLKTRLISEDELKVLYAFEKPSLTYKLSVFLFEVLTASVSSILVEEKNKISSKNE